MPSASRSVPYLLAMALLTGCTDASHEIAAPIEPTAELGEDFDPTLTGNIAGKVVWEVQFPTSPCFRHESTPMAKRSYLPAPVPILMLPR